MIKTKLAVAILISFAFYATVRVLHRQNHALVRQLNQTTNELSTTKTQLQQVQIRLADAEKKLGFLDKNQTPVQVTAYTKASSSSMFANGKSVTHAYAVPQHTLPENEVVSVALSPSAQVKLHAHMNDYIVLVHRHSHRKTLAKFVDTMPSEHRDVVDVLFSNDRQAWVWGRKTDYYAVNISSVTSPFKGGLGGLR
jgi:hypothetical protein